MRTGKYLLLPFLVIAIVALFTYTEAGAVANGDGTCSTSEYDNNDCVDLGGNIIEYRGALSGTVTVAAGTVPATIHFYKYSGGSTNQVIFGMPRHGYYMVSSLNTPYIKL